MDFGTWFKQRRLALGYSQDGLARKLGVDRVWVTRVETGVIKLPHETNRIKMHEVFGTTEEELWREVDRNLTGSQRHVRDSLGQRLDDAMMGMSDEQRQAAARLIEQMVRVFRAMNKGGGGDAQDRGADATA